MNASAIPFGLPDTAPALARRFAVIMAGLGALIARRFLKMPHLARFTLLLWGRLNRAVRRLQHALTHTPAKPLAPRLRAHRASAAQDRPLALPRGRGWIVRELGWEAAVFMGQLETLLAEIESQAVLAATPGAGRVLRPICGMLGVTTAVTPKIAPRVAAPEVIGRPGLRDAAVRGVGSRATVIALDKGREISDD